LLYIFLYSLLSAVYIISAGLFFKNNNDFNTRDICLSGIFGSIILSFAALFLNFITPLDKTTSTLIFLLMLSYGVFYVVKKKKIKPVLFIALIVALLSTLILILDNINRPDAGLYHLPYTKIINENKIIFGISNLHFRFGHTSILQYLNAIFNNQIFNENGILLPAATVFSIIVVYFFNEIKKNYINDTIYALYIYFVLTYILYGYNRYSEFGNDAISHLFFLVTSSYFFKEFFYEKCSSNILGRILILSIFTFMLKPTLILILTIPVYCYYFYIKKDYLINKTNLVIIFFVALWFLKNIIISGCLLYPVEITCFDSLPWFSNDSVFTISAKAQSLDNEAWTKGWPDYRGEPVTQDFFVKKFFWFKTWFFGHGIQILKKLSFFIIFLFVSSLIVRKIHIKNKTINKKLNFLLALSFLGILLWFFRFPIFRYGSSYIIIFIVILSLIFIIKNKLKYKINIRFFKFFRNSLLIFFVLFTTKHIIRIYNNYDIKYFNYPWPKIYSQNEKTLNLIIKTEPIIINGVIAYYMNNTDEGCGYNPSPCTGIMPNKITFFVKNTYKFYNLVK
jgi:hypothetical protein